MASLEQSAIDELVAEAAILLERRRLATDAKIKINEMCKAVIGYINIEQMDTLSSIGIVISDINNFITPDSIYYPSFTNLKLSYQLIKVQ